VRVFSLPSPSPHPHTLAHPHPPSPSHPHPHTLTLKLESAAHFTDVKKHARNREEETDSMIMKIEERVKKILIQSDVTTYGLISAEKLPICSGPQYCLQVPSIPEVCLPDTVIAPHFFGLFAANFAYFRNPESST